MLGRPPGSRTSSFGPRLRRVVWLVPLGAGLTFSALAIRSCTAPEVCYAFVGGVQVVVPCGEAEGEMAEKDEEEVEKDPSPTPEIDCPDPGRGNSDAYEIAKSGGTHTGYLRQAEGFADSSLHSALTSFEEQVSIHADRIANPAEQKLRKPWDEMESDEQQRVLTDWCGDLKRNRQLADVIYGVMKERGIDP